VIELSNRKEKPVNILLFFTDQQRGDTIHALGNDIIETPNMDRLVREGVAFERAFTPSPVCVPGRCSMYYGLYPHHTGCADNGDPGPKDRPTMMELLTKEGYRTHGIGKMHFSPDGQALCGFQSRERQEEGVARAEDDDYLQYLLEKGYTHVFDPHGQRSEMYYIPQLSQLPARDHPTQWVGDRSIEFIRNHDFSKPFFLMSSFIHPHPPFAPPTPWNKIYRAKDMPHAHVPENYEDCLTYINHFQNRYKYRDQGIDRNLLRTQKAFYYSCISFIDYQIGRILQQLEELGQLDNTLIILTADHGELLGDYNSFGKRSMLNSAARIPMIVRFPVKMEKGMQCSKPVSLVDVMPTALDAAGIDAGDLSLDGESLIKIASGEARREYVISQFQKDGLGLYMIATEDKKYFYSAPDDKEYYFDNVADPMETKNLMSSEGSPEAADLKKELIRVLRESGQDGAVDGEEWRKYPKRKMPEDPDEGLLFQDHLFGRERETLLPDGYTVKYPPFKFDM
jgi:arylsulfatase